jgi:hypothetical protein
MLARFNLVTRYAVLPPQRDKEVSVTEKWTIRHNGRVVRQPDSYSKPHGRHVVNTYYSAGQSRSRHL